MKRTTSLLAILLLATLGCIVGAEWILRARKQNVEERRPVYARLQTAHAPFSIRHPHPEYGFFFPSDPVERAALNNDIVSVSRSGFRGPGPEAAEGRTLAFLVGNSVVFGFVPHDSLTITGFLNRMQSQYFFVNAGVPSWTSLQMRKRTVRELLRYEPGLIVVWGGHNDASLAYRTAAEGREFTRDAIEEPSALPSAYMRVLRRVAPNVTEFASTKIRSVLKAEPIVPKPAAAINAAEAFAANLAAIHDITSARGIRFLAVYQPILHHHAHRPPGFVSKNEVAFFASFHSYTLSATKSIPLLDLSDLFDRMYAPVPVFGSDPDHDLNGQVFIDTVHLYIPGNREAAHAITAHLGS